MLLINIWVGTNPPYLSEDINKLYSKIEDVSHEEKLVFLENKLEELNTMIEDTVSSFSMNGNPFYLNTLTGEYITNDIFSELRLYELVYDEVRATINYSEYLATIDEQAESIGNFAIMSDPKSFDYKNIKLAPEVYSDLKGVELKVQSSQGITNALTNIAPVFFMLLLSVVFSVSLCSEDTSTSVIWLLKSTKKGRTHRVFAQVVLCFIFCFFVCAIFMLSSLITNNFVLGLGDLSVPIQSVSTFYSSPLNVSVLEYVVIQFIFSLTSMFTVCLISIVFVSKIANEMLGYFSVIVFIVVEFLAFTFIQQNSYLNFFKYVNIFCAIMPHSFFSSLINLNFFNFPVSVILVFSISFLALILLLIFVLYKHAHKSRAITFKNIFSLKLKHKYSFSLFSHEAYKILISNKAIYILAACLAFGVYNFVSYTSYYDEIDSIYKDYIEAIEGEINSETLQYIEDEQERYLKIDEALINAQEQFDSGKISEEELELVASSIRMWDDYKVAFEMLKGEVNYLRTIGEDTVIYKTGYNKIIGVGAVYSYSSLNVIGIISLILCIAPFYSYDNNRGMHKLINCTVNGKWVLLDEKITLTVIVSSLISIIAFLPFIMGTLKFYGYEQITENLNLIINTTFNMPTILYILLLLVMFCSVYSLFGLAMLFISRKCKTSIISMAICSILFLVPSILFMVFEG